MNIAVLVKLVPDTAAMIRLNAEKSGIETRDLNWVLNPYDEYAAEEALALVEKNGGEVTAIACGTDNMVEALRKTVAMGANNAMLIKRDGPYDQLATAKAIANTIKDRNFDMIFAGYRTTGDDSTAIGPMVATLLGLPCIAEVNKLDVGDGKVTAERNIEGGTEVIEASIPCVITAQKGLNEPRYPKLKGIMMAKKKVIEEIDGEIGTALAETTAMSYQAERPAGKIVGEGVEAVPELVRLLREEAKVIE
jgi:electron transfer flavoprotein beta subunit